MPIPAIKRSLYNGRVNSRMFSDIPEDIEYIYCNCQIGLDHNTVLLTDRQPEMSDSCWYCPRSLEQHIAKLEVNPVICDDPRKMIVRLE